MGCDGGTIPRRDELVKTKQKPEKKDKDADRLYRWRHCAVSQKKLRHPIVACELGRLYNKDEVISRLIEKVADPAMAHIKSLKDIKELRLTTNPAYREDGALKGDEYVDQLNAEYICPVTSQEMNGKCKFSFIWTCGCVLSDKALSEVVQNRCLVCNQSFVKDDVIPVNPCEEEQDKVRSLMSERRARLKASKKIQKEGKRSVEDNQLPASYKKQKLNISMPGPSKKGVIVNGMASSILRDAEFEKIRSSKFTVASDSRASEVFKSIFDSHESAKGKQKAHWVTCNPQYY